MVFQSWFLLPVTDRPFGEEVSGSSMGNKARQGQEGAEHTKSYHKVAVVGNRVRIMEKKKEVERALLSVLAMFIQNEEIGTKKKAEFE
ncbi:hypothetical protein V6N13_105527 [Hibiscus sabdariffa]